MYSKLLCHFFFLIVFLPLGSAQRTDQILTDSSYATLYQQCLVEAAAQSEVDWDCLFREASTQFSTSSIAHYEAVWYAMIKEERAFRMENAIVGARYLVGMGRAAGDSTMVAEAFQNLYRYNDAIGRRRESLASLERATEIWRGLEMENTVLQNEFMLLEIETNYLPLDSLYGEMQHLLAKAEEMKDASLLERMHIRMVRYAYALEWFDNMEQHLVFLGELPVSDPIKPMEYPHMVIHARGRAMLATARGKTAAARRWFNKALSLCRQEPSLWLEVDVLQALAKLEWEVGNEQKAYQYIDTSTLLAEERKIYDLLAESHYLSSKFARETGDYKAALTYYRKGVASLQKYNQRSAGFDMKNALLEKERNALALDKERNALNLQKKKLQLNMLKVGVIFIVLLTIGITLGLMSQRRKKQQLARQNKIIQEQAARLLDLDELKSQFFANASHELRTPLELILGPLKTLAKKGGLSSQQHQLLAIAGQAGQQMNQLINDILDLSKLEGQQLVTHAEPTDAGAFLSAHCRPWEEVATEENKHFYCDIQLSGMTLVLDRRKVLQIINNLLSNAFKFTEAGDSIRFIAQTTHDQLNITVEDGGLGITPADLPYVFDRYFQSNDPRLASIGGSGIGLALSGELAQLMGGSLKVQSTLGRGSVFRLALPVSIVDAPAAVVDETALYPKADRREEPVVVTPSQAGSTDRPLLLVVDDNAGLRKYLRMLLEPCYDIVMANNGREALNYLEDKTRLPDLVLSDLMMPVMDGLALLELVKSKPHLRHLPFIMLTARAQVRPKLKALRVGVDDYLTLPFDEGELTARIDNLLSHQATRRAMKEKSKTDNTQVDSEDIQLSDADQEWLEKFEAFAKKHLGDETLNVPRMAREFAMSESTLLRQLKRVTGLTPIKYIQELRLDRARMLLERGDRVSVQKVAAIVGYQDTRSFSRVFKKRFGTSPSRYTPDEIE